METSSSVPIICVCVLSYRSVCFFTGVSTLDLLMFFVYGYQPICIQDVVLI